MIYKVNLNEMDYLLFAYYESHNQNLLCHMQIVKEFSIWDRNEKL